MEVYTPVIILIEECEYPESWKKMVIEDTALLEVVNYKVRLRNALLIMIYELLTTSSSNIDKFGGNVSFKWTFMFMNKNLHPHTAVSASRILVVLSQNGYFSNSYQVLGRIMAHHGKIQQCYLCWFAILLGADVNVIPFTYTFSETLSMLLQFTKVKGRTINIHILGVITEMTKSLVKEASISQSEIESKYFNLIF